MARSVEMQNPEVRKLWWITLVVQSAFGFTLGLYLYTWGPYLYDKFGGSSNPSIAMLLTTILMGLQMGLIAILELPTGAFADTIGRAHVVVLSWIMRVLFFLFLAIIWLCQTPASAFAWAILASVAFALSYTFFNGAFSAWCTDVLRENAPGIQYGWLASRFYSYQRIMNMLGAVVAIVLYAKGLAFAGFILAAFVSFCTMGYAMSTMREVTSINFLDVHKIKWSAITRRIGEIIGKSSQICARTPAIFWVVFSFGSFLFLMNLVKYLWPVYFQSVAGGKAHYVRNWIAIAMFSEILSFVGSRMLVLLNKKWSRDMKSHLTGYRRIFTSLMAASALAIIAFSLETLHLFPGAAMFPIAVIVVCFAYGFVAPCYEVLVNMYLPQEEIQNRATVLSAGSMLRSLLVLLLVVPSGGSSSSESPAFWAIPATLLLFSAIAANVSMKRTQQERDEPATLAL